MKKLNLNSMLKFIQTPFSQVILLTFYILIVRNVISNHLLVLGIKALFHNSDLYSAILILKMFLKFN